LGFPSRELVLNVIQILYGKKKFQFTLRNIIFYARFFESLDVFDVMLFLWFESNSKCHGSVDLLDVPSFVNFAVSFNGVYQIPIPITSS